MIEPFKKLKIAILGSGNIGTDLLVKTLRSNYLECGIFVGRNINSPGLMKAASLGVRVSDQSLNAIVLDPSCCDLVFDCTSARDHLIHWPVLKRLGKRAIDMTPAKIGTMCVPAVNLDAGVSAQNVNMITCGGQASIPIAHAIGRTHEDVDYIEIVSSISSRSAGPATRINIDEYIETTEHALLEFSGCKQSKAILVLNPAQPCIDMQTTVFAKVKTPNLQRLTTEVEAVVARIQTYVPGYQLLMPPMLENDRIVVMVKVQGAGDYLPKYAGNLDIINCAAIAVAEEVARRQGVGHKQGAEDVHKNNH